LDLATILDTTTTTLDLATTTTTTTTMYPATTLHAWTLEEPNGGNDLSSAKYGLLGFLFLLIQKKSIFKLLQKIFFFTFAVKDSEFASSSGKTGLGKNRFFILIRLRSIKYNYSRITT